MDNATAERVIEMNKRLIEAMGMHWRNQLCVMARQPPKYFEEEFSNLAYKPL